MGEALAGRRLWVWGVAAVVLALIGYGAVHALTAHATATPAAAALTAVDRGAVTTQVATTGTVQPAQTRSLSFAVAGTVDSVPVRPGTTVTAGQTLAKVDDTDAAKAVDDARAALDDARDVLSQARANASTSIAASSGCGSNVAAVYTVPSPSASPSPAPSATPRRTAAPAPSATPRRTAATAPSATNRSACGPNGQSGVDPIFSAEERVNQATTTLAAAEDALDGATITSPIAGRVISVAGKVGSQATVGSTFVTVADVYDMQISAEFPEADADRLAIRQKGVVTLADRPGEQFPATVVQVDPTGTSDGTMVRYGVLLAFDTAPKDLLVGQSASVRVTTGNRSDVRRVASTAVHDVHGDSGTVLKGGARLAVGVGLRGDQYTEITSGLSTGDQVARSW